MWLMKLIMWQERSLRLSDYALMCCKPITEHLSLFQLTSKTNITFFLFARCCNVQVNLLSLLFQTQLKTLNIFQRCSIYLFVFFKTRADWVTFVQLGAIGFDGLIVVDEVTSFGELGATLSDNLVLGGMILS